MVYFQLFIIMVLLHLFADFTLQGWFANGKQKAWWIKQCEDYGKDFTPYRYDYVCALIGHAVYWSIITFAPLIFCEYWPACGMLVVFLVFQIGAHAVIDDLKANKFKINLIQDQLAHILQIVLAVLVFYLMEV